VGYFTDNEIGFPLVEGRFSRLAPDAPAVSKGKPSLLQACLALPAGTPAREEAVRLALARRGLEGAGAARELCRLWGTDPASLDDLARLGADGLAVTSAGYAADDAAFGEAFAERYFRLSREAVMERDPNHLVMGCRWGGPPHPAVLRAMRPHVDVVSINNYTNAPWARLDVQYQDTGLPILIGEFAWPGDYFLTLAMPHEPKGGLAPLERMFEQGAAELAHVVKHPGVVGYTWYRWVGPNPGLDPATYGLVNCDDDAVGPLVEALSVANAVMEEDAASADCVRGLDPSPLDGRLTLTLDEGKCARQGAFMATDQTMLGLVMQDGLARPGSEVTGYGLWGRVVSSARDGALVRIVIEVRYHPVLFRETAGPARYALLLGRRGDLVEGTFAGDHDGLPVSGRVAGRVEAAE
jgi:hypothetical protein